MPGDLPDQGFGGTRTGDAYTVETPITIFKISFPLMLEGHSACHCGRPCTGTKLRVTAQAHLSTLARPVSPAS